MPGWHRPVTDWPRPVHCLLVPELYLHRAKHSWLAPGFHLLPPMHHQPRPIPTRPLPEWVAGNFDSLGRQRETTLAWVDPGRHYSVP